MILIPLAIGLVVGIGAVCAVCILSPYLPTTLTRPLANLFFEMSCKNYKRLMFQGQGGGLRLVSSSFNNELLCEEVKLGRKSFNYYSDSYGIQNPFLNIGPHNQYPIFITSQKFSFIFSPVLLAYGEKIKRHVSAGEHMHIFKRTINKDPEKELPRASPKKGNEVPEEEEPKPAQPDEEKEIQWVNAHILISKDPELVDLSACESLLLASGESSLPELLSRYVRLSQTGYVSLDHLKNAGSILISFGAGLGLMYFANIMTNPNTQDYITEVNLWLFF